MAINKVVYGANTLIDLTGDTVTADTLKTGFTAHDKSGTAITGTLDLAEGSVYQDEDGCVVLNDDDGSGVSYIPLTVSSNGTYTASSSYCYNPVTVNVDNQYYSIYKSLAFRSVIASNASEVSEWADSLSVITTGQFANQDFSGSFIFNNVKEIRTYAFGSVSGTTIVSPKIFTISFPRASYIGNAAFTYNHGLKAIYAPILDSISDSTFYRCSNLTSVDFSVASIITPYAFYSCSKLTDVSIPSAKIIKHSAFYGCSSLSSINFPVASIISDYAFCMCSGLTVVSFPVATTIGNRAFSGCSRLASVNFPVVTSIGTNAFYFCSSLSSIQFPNCSSIGNAAFSSCSSLVSVSFPNCDFIGTSAFGNCSSLQSISFPVCVSIQNYAFGYCYALESACFPKCDTINQYAFILCSALRQISLPVCTFIYGPQVFSGCISLESVYLLGASFISINDTNMFRDTPLSKSSYLGYFGSIFVRQSLLASYKNALYWAAYSSRFVGLTDEEIAALDAS